MDFNRQNQQFPDQKPQGYNNSYYQNQQHQYNNRYSNPNYNNQPYDKQNYYINEMQKKREKSVSKTKLEKTEGFVLLWCLVSIILAVIIAEKEAMKSWTVVLLGQAFACLGIMCFVKQKHKLEGYGFLLLIFAGTVMFAAGLLMAFGGQEVNDRMSELAPYAVVGAFYVVGLSMLIFPPIINKKKKERCTFPVQAVVIDHIRNHSSKRRTYTPLFEYEYRGEKYTERDNVSIGSISDLPMIGKRLPAYINEEDPTDFYVEWEGKKSSMIVAGICIMLLPSILLIVLILQNAIK